MIVSDTHEFCFIHIPKCAGSSVRNVLEQFDDRDNYYWMGSFSNFDLGIMHRAHLTVDLLRKNYPDEFRRIKNYKKFAVVRNPAARFLSAFKQYLITNDKPNFETLSYTQIAIELEEAINRLESGEQLNPWLVHFTPQVEFVFDEDALFVPTLFPVEKLNNLYGWVGQMVGQSEADIAPHSDEDKNVSFAYRNAFLRRIFSPIQPFARYVVPSFVRKPVGRMIKSKPKIEEIPAFNTPAVREFIANYYAEDFELYAAVCAGDIPATRHELAAWSAR